MKKVEFLLNIFAVIGKEVKPKKQIKIAVQINFLYFANINENILTKCHQISSRTALWSNGLNIIQFRAPRCFVLGKGDIIQHPPLLGRAG